MHVLNMQFLYTYCGNGIHQPLWELTDSISESWQLQYIWLGIQCQWPLYLAEAGSCRKRGLREFSNREKKRAVKETCIKSFNVAIPDYIVDWERFLATRFFHDRFHWIKEIFPLMILLMRLKRKGLRAFTTIEKRVEHSGKTNEGQYIIVSQLHL